MTDLTIDDFITGLLAQLAHTGRSTISIKVEDFHPAIEKAFHRLEELAPEYDLDIRFYVTLHPFHGDSSVIQSALSAAAQRSLISLDGPDYQLVRLKISPLEAERLLDSVPGRQPLFAELDQVFTQALEHQPIAQLIT